MMQLTHLSDHELLRQVAEGDAEAFTVVFERHWNRIYNAAWQMLRSAEAAEDITQEVFLRIWKDRARAVEIQNLEAFLFVQARHLTFNRFRRQKIEQNYQSYLIQTIASSEVVAANYLAEFNDLKGDIEAAIRSLPPQQQTAFRLSREKGLSHAEIAREMNLGQKTVKDYIVRAIAHIRQFLQQRAALMLAIFLGLL